MPLGSLKFISLITQQIIIMSNTLNTSPSWLVGKGRPLQGTLTIPGDKSVSHRAIMLAALANGVSQIDGFLEGEDTRATAAIFAQMGVQIQTPTPMQRLVHGVGLHGLKAPQTILDCGNAQHVDWRYLFMQTPDASGNGSISTNGCAD